MIDFSRLTDEDLGPLTDRQREVFERRRRGEPWRTVCAEMGISMAAAQALVQRGVQHLVSAAVPEVE